MARHRRGLVIRPSDEFKLPVTATGSYRVDGEGKFESPQVVWSYARGTEHVFVSH